MKRFPLRSGASILLTLGLVACGAPPDQGSNAESSSAAATSSTSKDASNSAPTSSPIPSKARPMAVGDGLAEYTLQAPAGTAIYTATGSLPSVSIGSETDTKFGANTYGLQLNTNTFYISPSFCDNHPPASQANLCTGWEQFVYRTNGEVGDLFVEYWLIDTGSTTCLPGWTSYIDTSAPGISDDCYQDSPHVPAPVVPISALGTVSLSGTVSTSRDVVSFSIGSATPVTTFGDDIFSLATAGYGSGGVGGYGGWTAAEFNIFGWGGKSQANLSLLSTATIEIAAQYGVTSSDLTVAAPTCGNTSFTGETNNTTLQTCTPAGGRWILFDGAARMQLWPSISFTEEAFLPRIGPIHF